MTRKTPESYVLRGVLDYLAVKRIFAMRMNSGAVQDRRGIPVRMHESGTADVMAVQQCEGYGAYEGTTKHRIWWIECKAPNGKQSPLQKDFQEKVEAEGHRYILAFGIDDLERAGL
jgi:hypothetical protein